MAIIQEAFDVPEFIITGIANGDYRRIGGVVRWAQGPNKGQLVKMLDPVDLPKADEAKGLLDQAAHFVQQHKKEVGIATVGTIIVGGCLFVYYKFKDHEPKVVTNFRAALKDYVDAMKQGAMEVDKIDALMTAVNDLKSHKNYDKISIQLTTEEIEALVGTIHDYTVKLAEANSFSLADQDVASSGEGGACAVIDLQKYLQAQKRMMEESA